MFGWKGEKWNPRKTHKKSEQTRVITRLQMQAYKKIFSFLTLLRPPFVFCLSWKQNFHRNSARRLLRDYYVSKVVGSSFNFCSCVASSNYLLRTINLAPLVEHVKASSCPHSRHFIWIFLSSFARQHIFWGIAQVLRWLSRNSFLSADYTKRLTKQRSNGYGKMTRSIIAGINYACIVSGVEGTRKLGWRAMEGSLTHVRDPGELWGLSFVPSLIFRAFFLRVWRVLLIALHPSPDDGS